MSSIADQDTTLSAIRELMQEVQNSNKRIDPYKQVKEKIEKTQLSKLEQWKLDNPNASAKELAKQNKLAADNVKRQYEKVAALMDQKRLSKLLLQDQVQEHQRNQQNLKSRKDSLQLLLASAKTQRERKALAKEISEIDDKIEDSRNKEFAAQRHINAGATANASILEKLSYKYKQIKQYAEESSKIRENETRQLAEQQDIIDSTNDEKEKQVALDRQEEIRKAAQQEDNRAANAAGVDSNTRSSVSFKLESYLAKNNSVSNAVLSTLKSIQGTMNNQITAAMNVITQTMPQLDARLQSQEVQYGFTKEILSDIQSVVGASRYVSQQELINKVVELTDKGVNYNLEQRALYATLSDKMVTTFDAMSDNLLALIRVQQADLTGSQLGSEALLTKLFNSQFQDTSALSDVYDSILSTISEALSNMDVDQATSFSYTVEKWLGSLYSVGASSSLVNSLAEGINALATGDISALNSNPSVATLLNMSATNAGLSYSDLLTGGGLNSDNINDLMMSMVEYLANISDNTTSNQVERSQWADILGVSVTDLRAAKNLVSADTSAIYQSNVNYEAAMNEVENQQDLAKKRTSTGSQIDTLYNNILFDLGMNIAKSDAAYITWKVSDAMGTAIDTLGLDSVPGVDTVKTIISGIQGVEILGSAVSMILNGQLSSEVFDQGFYSTPYTNRGGMYSGSGTSLDSAEEIQTAVDEGYVTIGISSSSYVGIPETQYIESNNNLSDSLNSFVDTANGTSTGNLSSYLSSLSSNADVVASGNSSISGVSDVIDSGASSIYSELFDLQTKPIRVKLASLEQSVLSQLLTLLSDTGVADIDTSIKNLTSNVKSDSVATLMDKVSSVRGY